MPTSLALVSKLPVQDSLWRTRRCRLLGLAHVSWLPPRWVTICWLHIHFFFCSLEELLGLSTLSHGSESPGFTHCSVSQPSCPETVHVDLLGPCCLAPLGAISTCRLCSPSPAISYVWCSHTKHPCAVSTPGDTQNSPNRVLI